MKELLRQRANEKELLDLPGFDPDLARQGYWFMSKVNGFFGGVRNVRRFVAEQARLQPEGKPLRVLDIGAGICDIPIAVMRWALQHGIGVHFTCLEISDYAPAIARRRIERAGFSDTITVLEQDVFSYQPAEAYDCAVGSMFFHHLADDDIIHLTKHVRTIVRRSLLVNDLGRNWPDYLGAWLLTLPLASGARHDALLSIRRSFTPKDLKALFGRLGNMSVRASNTWLFRVEAIVDFIEGSSH